MPRRGVMDPGLEGANGRVDVFARLSWPIRRRLRRSDHARASAGRTGRIHQSHPRHRAERGSDCLGAARAPMRVVLRVDAADLPQIARDTAHRAHGRHCGLSTGSARKPCRTSVRTPRMQVGARGQRVRVAVIDSGIDYTHAALGGPGTQASYEAAWAPIPPAGSPAIPVVPADGYLVVDDPATAADDGLFPSSKVVGGYDFVGERWPNNVPAGSPPEPSPRSSRIRIRSARPTPRHSAVTARTSATSSPANWVWLRPRRSTLSRPAPHRQRRAAARRCSRPWTSRSIRTVTAASATASTSSTCRWVRRTASLSTMICREAVDNASKVGVLTVASAGNSADKQFITGSPAAASSALSVAQTDGALVHIAADGR